MDWPGFSLRGAGKACVALSGPCLPRGDSDLAAIRRSRESYGVGVR